MVRIYTFLCATIAILFLVNCAQADLEDFPSLNVVKCPSNLVPGSNWAGRGVQSASAYHNVVNPKLKALQPTTAFMCADESGIKFQFLAVDNNIIAPYQNCNDPLYNDDVVETFIPAPVLPGSTLDLHHYLELEVSPNSVLFASHITNSNLTCAGISGNLIPCASSGIVYQAHKSSSPQGFWAYLSVPWSLVVTDANVLQRLESWTNVSELSWRGNFFRIDTPKNNEKEYTSWSAPSTLQPRACFHQPRLFGIWRLQDSVDSDQELR